MTSNGALGQIQVFDKNGRFSRLLGRPGGGPGEFRDRPHIVAIGDSVVAFDFGAMRATVFSSEYVLLRTVPMPVPVLQAVQFENGQAVVTGESRSRDFLGVPLQLVDPSGRLVRSFGARNERVDLDEQLALPRIIARSSGGRVWSSPQNDYVVELWDTTGTLQRTLRRDADWFHRWTQPPQAPRLIRPPPMMSALQQRDDRLWALVRVADADWKPRAGTPMKGMGPRAIFVSDSDKELIYDTIVEVIDLSSGRLLLSKRVPQNLLGFVGDGMVASYEEDKDGNPRYVVWRLDLSPN